MTEPSIDQKPELDVMGSPTQKRKRGVEPGSPDTRRSKRGTSAAAVALPVMQQPQQQQQQQQQSPPQQQPLEAAATAFMEESSQMPTTTAGGGGGDQQGQSDGSGLTTAEFSVIDAVAAATGVANAGSVDHSDAAAAANAAALASSTAAAALGSLFPTLHVPQPTEETFANQQVDGGVEHQHMSPQQQLQQQQQQQAQLQHPHGGDASAYGQVGDVSGTPDGLSALEANDAVNGVMGKRSGSTFNAKPAVGTDEWHKMRKDNHKEVERRRRETINEGINELAKIVPGCEKNKGSILQRAVMFITQLKENETQNIEKWTLEKLLTEQAIAELSASNDKLKAEVDRLYREVETWKNLAQSAGLQPVEEKTEPAS